ncbi:HAD family hydrolase [Nocardioides pantholopis]|uniref:HAD family hydrolase n=1 Tax=Nocardioides pantholopis TaxID=2483798 RepID=UPI000FD8D02A|nr:HAD family hydrolase [Nocardioides pantholopis]
MTAQLAPALVAVLTLALAVALAAYVAAPALAHALARRRGRASGVSLPARAALAAAPHVDLLVADAAAVTTGRLRVVDVAPARAGDERNLRWFAGALGHGAEDPVSRALARSSPRGHLSGVTSQDGLGLCGSVDRHPVRVGQPAWLGDLDHGGGSGSTVAVEVDGRLLGRITLAAEPRPDAAATLTALAGRGIEPVLVSSGPAADLERLAGEVGTARCVHLPGPGDLSALVSGLRAEGRVVALAGPDCGADLRLTDAGPDPGAVVLDELDIASVAAALDLARSVHRTARLLRRVALALAVLAAAGLGAVALLRLL